MGLVTVKWTDFSNEKSSTAFNVVDASGAAFDWAGLETQIDTIVDAMEAVTLCTRGSESVRQVAQLGTEVLPADENAQRELGLRIFYQDQVTMKKYHFTIPGPDLTLMVLPGFDVVDWSGAEMTTLESVIEANVLSPDGNAIQIITGTIVGRRN